MVDGIPRTGNDFAHVDVYLSKFCRTLFQLLNDNKFPAMFSSWIQRLQPLLGRFVPRHLEPEVGRRMFLFIILSLEGMIFGCIFAGFYIAIGYYWGAAIVLVCTLAMGGAPWIVRAVGLESAGNIYAGILVLGFTALTGIEGGIRGHAVAWLAVVPLCSCILVDQRMGRVWCTVCMSIVSVFVVLDLAGITLRPLYNPHWERIIIGAGYLTLALFMSLLGVSFERSRRECLRKLHAAHDELSVAHNELAAAHDEVSAINTRLQELNEERSAFLGIAAHDLRSPLGTIMGFARFLQQFEEDQDSRNADCLGHILAASTRMRDLLDQFLSLEAITEGKVQLRRESCDLAALAGEIVEKQRATAAAKSIQLIFEREVGLRPVTADVNATSQILDNLLSNAIKFSPPHRPVTVRVCPTHDGSSQASFPEDDRQKGDGGDNRCAWRGNGMCVEVQDAGPGLSDEDQRKLYGRFVKLSARPTAGESSSGLGLSIVKRLAEAMEGTIACRSRLGEGAIFSLTLYPARKPMVDSCA